MISFAERDKCCHKEENLSVHQNLQFWKCLSFEYSFLHFGHYSSSSADIIRHLNRFQWCEVLTRGNNKASSPRLHMLQWPGAGWPVSHVHAKGSTQRSAVFGEALQARGHVALLYRANLGPQLRWEHSCASSCSPSVSEEWDGWTHPSQLSSINPLCAVLRNLHRR